MEWVNKLIKGKNCMKHKILILPVILFLFPMTAFPNEWTQIESPNISYYSIWGNSGTDVFAGGPGGVYHHDGNTWSIMHPSVDIYSIWGSSGTDIYVVGGSYHQGAKSHYNGINWVTTYTQETYVYYSDIWGSSGSDIWVTGNGFNVYNGTGFSFMEHFNGTNWANTAFLLNLELNGVWGSSTSDFFAVGDSGLIRHYNGNNWSAMTSGTANTLNDIWGSSSTDVFAVGMQGSILHYNGSNWSTMTSGTTNDLYNIWGSSDSDVFAVGTNGTILHYDGNGWSAMVSGTTNTLRGVWGSSDSDVFAVGDTGTILHYEGTLTTTTVPSTTTISTTTTAPPTVVTLIGFEAVPGKNMVTLKWSTATELDNAGFNLYRLESADGAYSKINDSLIIAQGSSTQGASYEFTDNNVQNRKTYYYKLEDIDLSGKITMHGPVSATPRLIYGMGK
jgi:hypothetical protein